MSYTQTATTVVNAPEPAGGFQIGNAAADLVAFHGSTPVDQAAAITSVTTTALILTPAYGFTTTAQANAMITAVNSVLVALREKGIIAT